MPYVFGKKLIYIYICVYINLLLVELKILQNYLINLHALYKENHLYATFYIKKRQKKGGRKRVLMET